MPRSNRRSQQPYVPPKLPHPYAGAEGYYVFVPAEGFGLSALGAGANPKLRPEGRLPVPGHPPAQARAPEPLHTETFRTVAEEWFGINSSRWVETYRTRLRSRLDDDLMPQFGDWNIADIQPLEVLATIRRIEERGAVEMAKRILNMASSVFRYGVATARCRRDPTIDIRGALRPAQTPKTRKALPAKDIPVFMKALQSYDGEKRTGLALRLLVLTFVRTAELRFAKWSEFEDLEGSQPLWRIPAERMKLRRPHLVPLAPQAVSVLKALRKIRKDDELLLPASTRSGVISENTLLFALYRMGYHNRATVHGFRATASTILNEAQFNPDWVEMQLAHCDSSIRGVYNFAQWLPGRREMLIWWADYLDGLCDLQQRQ